MAFFEGALEAGDSLIAVASEPHRHLLRTKFTAMGFDLAGLVDSGRLVFGDADSTLDVVNRAGTPDRERFVAALDPLFERALDASTGSPAHVSMFGEIAPILCARGELDAMVRLERIADEYTAGRPLSLLCGYSTDCVSDRAIDLATTICAEHAAIVPA
jgi:hypothetical protein